MKIKHYLFFLILFVAKLSFAQGNLQFNRVISENVNLNQNERSTLITVPIGKVWKIEAMNLSDKLHPLDYEINGNAYTVSTLNYGNNIWLKSGDTFSMLNNSIYSNHGFYSIIEFNIVP